MATAEGTQFESDEFLALLSEALRAGPGSPAWHEAVRRLREANPAEADEYRLLIAAREHLESGRDYRSISAGPGFTRKVMQQIDDEGTGRAAPVPTATIIAILAGIAALAVVITIVIIASRSPQAPRTIEDLRQQVFTRPVLSADLAAGIPAEWKKFGIEPVVTPRGLRGGVEKNQEREYRSGGVHLASPIAAGQAFAIEAAARVAGNGNRVDMHVFITDDPAAATPRDFVVDLKNGEVVAYRDGQMVGDAAKIARGDVVLRVKVDRQFVIVEADGRQVYAGPHGLPADKPRFPGIRFLTRGQETDEVTVQKVTILNP